MLVPVMDNVKIILLITPETDLNCDVIYAVVLSLLKLSIDMSFHEASPVSQSHLLLSSALPADQVAYENSSSHEVAGKALDGVEGPLLGLVLVPHPGSIDFLKIVIILDLSEGGCFVIIESISHLFASDSVDK
jgi:hypothetical protein